MYEYRVLMMPSRIKQGFFNKHSKVKHCFKINSKLSKQDKKKKIRPQTISLVNWFLPQNKLFPRDQRH